MTNPGTQKALGDLDAWLDHMDGMSYAQKYLCVREKYKQAQELVVQELIAPVGNAIGTDDCFGSWGKFISSRCSKVNAAFGKYLTAKNAYQVLPKSNQVRIAMSADDVVEKKVWSKQGARPTWAHCTERKQKAAKNLRISAALIAITALTDIAMLQISGWNALRLPQAR